MTRRRPLMLLVLTGLASVQPCVWAASDTPGAAAAAARVPAASDATPVLVTAIEWQRMANEGARYPLFVREQERAIASVRAAMKAGVNVPVPKDPGGGASHEQHKRNYQVIQAAGALYRLTGDRAYADYARDVLLAYARLYPTLGAHPAGRSQVPGRLFWQSLNDSVWLVYASQGYDAIRESLSPADRKTIDEQVFRRMARFLSDENPDNFNKIHNHATWAVAAVGMTGYVLRDREMVDKALLGAQKDGKAGFLKQIDLLFSPDGYYAEGPYYQRYALAPFVLFARAIERNQPQQKIFQHRDGVLLKAVDTLVQSSYAGYFFPINDSILDKGLDTEELVAGIGIAYAQTQDARLLSVAQRQQRILLTPEGLEVAASLAAGKAKPFEFRSVLLRDGADGKHGALAILRNGGEDGQTLVMKNTSQGMGHGHFDKLNWLFYDNGQRVVTDYGAVRFLNVEAKSGGIYLPENNTWAKSTVAHNTLVVNERNHFDGKWRVGEEYAPTPLLFARDDDGRGNSTQIVSARMDHAYEGVSFTRTQAMLEHPDLGLPIVLDLLRVDGTKPARYDLPLHFNGQIMRMGFAAKRAVAERPVLGKTNGYQHLWVDAASEPSNETRSLSWLLDGRFYSYRFGSSVASRAILAESGANDPDFNLRHEPVLIQRTDGQAKASFFGVLEPHGEYNGTAEYVRGADSRIRDIVHARGDGAEVIVLTLVSGKTLALAVADDATGTREHSVQVGDQRYAWRGGYARFDRAAGSK